MKSIKNTTKGTYLRVSDKEADLKTRGSKDWTYCSKKEWKNKGASAEQNDEIAPEIQPETKKKREKKKK